MDPLTHALLGASAAHIAFGRSLGRRAALIGGVAALLPDADVLIRSSADPLLAIEHHRGFTHSLAFVPVGASVAAMPWLAARWGRRAWAAVLGSAAIGYATHGPLDAVTTYGTQLFWPFSSFRVGLDWISIIDPVFTLVLLIGLVLALGHRAAGPAVLAVLVGLAYLAIGAVQRERALLAQEALAAQRGHVRERAAAFPAFANNLVWRSLYQAGDSLYTDRIRVAWSGGAQWSPGTAMPLLRERDLPAAIRAEPRLVRDFRRFAWFSDDWVARSRTQPDLIGDVRYSLETAAYEPVWGIRLHAGAPAVRTEWVNRSRERRIDRAEAWAEIIGRDPTYRRVR